MQLQEPWTQNGKKNGKNMKIKVMGDGWKI
jgi:hypothetical protein